MEYILEMKDIHKSFGPVQVLNGIDFSLMKGEVRALLGANGAGKSTLIKIVGGVHSQTSGDMLLRGERIQLKNEHDSRQKGISIIYQELSLVPTLTVVENMFLGRESMRPGGFLNKIEMYREYARILGEFSFDIDPDTTVSELSIANQQMVEIMKAVSCNADLVIMDEPTTSLTDREKEGLFRIIGKLKEMGKSIIYITHILEEVFRICDSASIMRGGVMVGSFEIGELDKAVIAQLMTGNAENRIKEKKDYGNADYSTKAVLQLKNLCRGDVVKNVSFCVHRGEVVGLAGLVGSRRTEIVNMIFGIDRKTGGEILINGEPVDLKSPGQAIAHKIGYIPEDRKHLGLILDQEIYKNATAVQVSKFRKGMFLDRRKEIEFADRAADRLGIKLSHVGQKIKELSGGNQQKVVVSKWLGQKMDLIIYDEPTKGIDIAAKEDIFHTIEEFSGQGIAVIFISSDLEEVIRVSDRVVVIREGTAVCELKNEGLTVQDIMNRIFDV